MEELRFNERYYRVERRELAYLKFIIEAYEGLAVMSTIERDDAVVRLGYPPSAEEELVCLMRAMADEIRLTEIPRPDGCGAGLPDLQERKA